MLVLKQNVYTCGAYTERRYIGIYHVLNYYRKGNKTFFNDHHITFKKVDAEKIKFNLYID